MIFWLLLALLATLYVRRTWKHPKGFPQGPRTPVPFLGDLSILLTSGRDLKSRIHQLGKPYDDIFGLWLGSNRVVFVKSYDLMVAISNNPYALGKLAPSHSCKYSLSLDGQF